MNKAPKINILVIDDDPKVRELLQVFFNLKSEEFICAIAADTQQAVLKMSNQEFDIFIIDNIMPGRTGIDFALSLRKSIKYSRTPIILMSGSLQQVDVLKAMEGGIKDILVKPFSLTQLGDKITSCLERIK
ncbi:MAG: response regulator [Alphaproteobacteria bacterium]|nr:MAG: response regulator [Alphaproteobacteria bacterium]